VGIRVHNGRYEGELGYLTMEKVLPNADAVVSVRVGFHESRVWLPLRCLEPHRTTARPRFVSPEDASPIISVIGEHVVLIGADVSGNSDWFGEYGQVVQCPVPCPPGSASVQAMSGPSLGYVKFFEEKSLCRSWQMV
jgi:hypothetical protein